MAVLLRHVSGPVRGYYYGRRCLVGGIMRRWETTTTSTQKKQVFLDYVTHQDDEHCQIAQLTLNRPKANAMGHVFLQELQDCLQVLEEKEKNTARCVIITSSSPKVFSAGADLKERKEMTLDEAADFVTLLRNTMQRVADLPQPVVVAMEGVALGGGLELALAADWRIASKTATLGLPETSLAIVPGAGGTQRLPRLIGPSKAKELIWTGRRIKGDEAYQLGMVDQVVEPGRTLEAALEMAWKISANGPIAIRASKEAINKGLEAKTMEEALEIERQNYAKVLQTQDRLEGLAAFQEGRTPVYKGE